MKKYLRISSTLLLSMCLTQGVIGQNIVTIFGQEKIEKTDEGEVFHRFNDGLKMFGTVNQGTLFNGQDMVAWMYASGNFKTPQAGEKLSWKYPNPLPQSYYDQMSERLKRYTGVSMQLPTEWQWESIETDSTGVFRSGSLISSYLYTSYDSPKSEIVLLETTGGTRTYVNGFPHEGDHYDFGYTLIPIKLKKGLNEFVYTPGRFGRVASKLVKPEKPVMFTKRDMTLPDLIIGESDNKWAAIRVVNASDKPLKGLKIRATLSSGESATYNTQDVMSLTVRKMKFQLPAVAANASQGEVGVKIELLDPSSKVIDVAEINVRQVPASIHHERTFVSSIDGSVQYFSVAPALRQSANETKALVLTVHGAGVEARNQARAYKQKEWTDIAAATNRRPYGFNWEEWGRIDALEVLEEARRVFKPDNSKVYLTGHSMGGHGSWFLGTTYPDKFAAVAPCAGYPDIAGYGRDRGDAMHSSHNLYEAFQRGANGGRVVTMAENLKQSGVYIFHGNADSVVSPSQARRMREVLGKFHTDFCYYEFPGGEHWFGDESVDWPPIFEFFKRHNIPAYKEIMEIDFQTASPAISPNDYWVRIEQQVKAYDFSRFKAKRVNDSIQVSEAKNIALMVLDVPSLGLNTTTAKVIIDNQILDVPTSKKAILALENNKWIVKDAINKNEKYSERYGGFKLAYTNHVVLVYPTKGSVEENEWYTNKARFDAETFYYRGNGSVDVVSDVEYNAEKFAGRNVVIYGNKDNNRAWNALLSKSPIQVSKGQISYGSRTLTGDDLGTYFIYPHPSDNKAMVGVVSGTGNKGMWATSPNNYISGITGFPDIMIFRADALRDGLEKFEVAGYFNNNWSVE